MLREYLEFQDEEGERDWLLSFFETVSGDEEELETKPQTDFLLDYFSEISSLNQSIDYVDLRHYSKTITQESLTELGLKKYIAMRKAASHPDQLKRYLRDFGGDAYIILIDRDGEFSLESLEDFFKGSLYYILKYGNTNALHNKRILPYRDPWRKEAIDLWNHRNKKRKKNFSMRDKAKEKQRLELEYLFKNSPEEILRRIGNLLRFYKKHELEKDGFLRVLSSIEELRPGEYVTTKEDFDKQQQDKEGRDIRELEVFYEVVSSSSHGESAGGVSLKRTDTGDICVLHPKDLLKLDTSRVFEVTRNLLEG